MKNDSSSFFVFVNIFNYNVVVFDEQHIFQSWLIKLKHAFLRCDWLLEDTELVSVPHTCRHHLAWYCYRQRFVKLWSNLRISHTQNENIRHNILLPKFILTLFTVIYMPSKTICIQWCTYKYFLTIKKTNSKSLVQKSHINYRYFKTTTSCR